MFYYVNADTMTVRVLDTLVGNFEGYTRDPFSSSFRASLAATRKHADGTSAWSCLTADAWTASMHCYWELQHTTRQHDIVIAELRKAKLGDVIQLQTGKRAREPHEKWDERQAIAAANGDPAAQKRLRMLALSAMPLVNRDTLSTDGWRDHSKATVDSLVASGLAAIVETRDGRAYYMTPAGKVVLDKRHAEITASFGASVQATRNEIVRDPGFMRRA